MKIQFEPEGLIDDPEYKAAIEAILAETSRLDEKLGVAPMFQFELIEEKDDWSYVVKLCAYFEAVLSQLIVERLGEETGDVVGNLPFAENKSSKARLAKALGIISDGDFRFFRALAEVRNIYVHRIANVTRTFGSILPELKEAGKNYSNLLALEVPKDERFEDKQSILLKFAMLAKGNVAMFHVVQARVNIQLEKRRLKLGDALPVGANETNQ